MIKRNLLIFAFIVFSLSCFSQDVDYARDLVGKLAGADFYGRGYVNGGDSVAAAYIADQFTKNGLVPVDSSFFQQYYFPINTLPGKIHPMTRIFPGLPLSGDRMWENPP